MADVHAVGVHHPRHDLIVGVDVGRGHVLLRTDGVDDFRDVPSGERLELAARRDGWQERVELVALPADEGERLRRQVAEQLQLPRLAQRRRFDVLHSTASVAPIVPRVPHAITLHDVTFFRHRTFGAVTTFGMRMVVAQAARRADALIAISDVACREIVETLGIPGERFVVVPNGHGRGRSVAAADPAAVRSRYGLDGDRVVLCVAAKRPHKNQEALVRAAPLLEVAPTWSSPAIRRRTTPSCGASPRETGGGQRVRFADYVPDAELEALWSWPTAPSSRPSPRASACRSSRRWRAAYPSPHRDIPVLREVGGEAPCYFDPHDPAALARAAEAAIREAPVRVPAGRARAERYSWAETARATLDAYERARAAAP